MVENEKKRKKSSTTSKTTYFVRGSGGKVSTEESNNNEDNDSLRQRDEEQQQEKKIQYDRTNDLPSHGNAINKKKQQQQHHHRFGKVMDQVPCTNKPRHHTLSIAIPGSIVTNCQTKELRTTVVGQIARAAAIYHVDEIIVYDDNLSKNSNSSKPVHYRDRKRNRNNSDKNNHDNASGSTKDYSISDPHEFMARILQYCECPQYLRKGFFPMHSDLQFAGLLNPLDAPHHVREGEQSLYREGVVVPDHRGETQKKKSCSLVNVGIRKTMVEIDRVLTPGIRCTVQFENMAIAYMDHTQRKSGQVVRGKVVSPTLPRETDGTYWGYTTRLASSITQIFEDSPYKRDGGYDLKIGTSERGDVTVDEKKFKLPQFKHCLIVFGGVAGIEECVDADESMKISGKDSKKLFDMW